MKKDLLNYAVAKIRTKESKLLAENSFIRLSQSRNVGEFVKLLAEFNYEPNENIDDSLTKELIATYDFVKDAVKGENILYPFLLKYDLFNISVYLKAELSKKDLAIEQLPFLPLGNIDVASLVRDLKERNADKIPKEIFDAFLEAREIYMNTQDISIAQIHLEKVGYEYILNVVKNIKSDFVIKYFKTDVDIKNLLFALRLKRINSEELIKRVLIEGGYIETSSIIKTFNVSVSELKVLFLKSLKNLEQAFIMFEEGKPFMDIEKELMLNLKDQISKTRLVAFGVEPIIAYVLNKENEIKKIRELYYKVLAVKKG